jgi:hypothetical protein
MKDLIVDDFFISPNFLNKMGMVGVPVFSEGIINKNEFNSFVKSISHYCGNPSKIVVIPTDNISSSCASPQWVTLKIETIEDVFHEYAHLNFVVTSINFNFFIHHTVEGYFLVCGSVDFVELCLGSPISDLFTKFANSIVDNNNEEDILNERFNEFLSTVLKMYAKP